MQQLEDFFKTLQKLQDAKYKRVNDIKIEDSGHTVGGLLNICVAIVARELQKGYQPNSDQPPRQPGKKKKSDPPEKTKPAKKAKKAEPAVPKNDPAKEMEVEEEEIKSKEEPKKEVVEIKPPPPKPKIRQTAYQEQGKARVIKVFYAKKCTKEHVNIQFFEDRLEWSITLPKTGEVITGVDHLWANIDPKKSTWTVNPYKVEVFMMKASPGHWDEVFKDAESISVGPYSSKTDWDTKQQALEKELEDDDPEGEAALMELFKKIYGDANDDTRRAMVKSYQTSGGTVLSTNWNEVKTKDYEGKDSVVPEGQEKKNWKDFM